MDALREVLIPLLWLVWLGVWTALSRKVKAKARREPRRSRVVGLAVLAAAVALLALPVVSAPWLAERFVPHAEWAYWGGVGLTLAGLLFAGWARRRLGGNWSAGVSIKQGHALVTDGPYALVRHPIYTGLLLAFAGSVLARGEIRGLLALALAILFLAHRMRLEERWMADQFGEAYRDYAQRVSALIPFLW
jgi:protein-S-isoprenylcysteine O-methyltransferase Ste14